MKKEADSRVSSVRSSREAVEAGFRLQYEKYKGSIKANLLRETIEGFMKTKKELADEIDMHIAARADLLRAKTVAEEATLLKDRFVSLVAHDLRAPLSGIIGLLDLLLDSRAEPLSEKQAGIVRRAYKSGANILTLIDKLLVASQFRTGKVAPYRKFIDPRLIADDVMSKFLPLAEGKGVALQNNIGEGGRIYVDRYLLGEVISNLVNNAIKFTPRGGKVAIEVPKNSLSCIEVVDTGVGVDPMFIPNLFRSEVKTSSRGTDGEVGSGIGLPFCKEIVEAHGGTITVTSSRGKGSLFRVNLPDVTPMALVMVADAGELSACRKGLGMLRCGMAFARNSNEARKIWEEGEEFHLCVIDGDDPAMGHAEFLKWLTESTLHPYPEIVLLTSGNAGIMREKVIRHEVSAILQKPSTAEKIAQGVVDIWG